MAKAYPEEKVGVFAQRGDAVEVVEYSELDPQEAASVDTSTRTTPQRFLYEIQISAFTFCRKMMCKIKKKQSTKK